MAFCKSCEAKQAEGVSACLRCVAVEPSLMTEKEKETLNAMSERDRNFFLAVYLRTKKSDKENKKAWKGSYTHRLLYNHHAPKEFIKAVLASSTRRKVDLQKLIKGGEEPFELTAYEYAANVDRDILSQEVIGELKQRLSKGKGI